MGLRKLRNLKVAATKSLNLGDKYFKSNNPVEPKEGKSEIVGISLDNRPIGIVCRVTGTRKVRVITVYEDKPKR